MSNLHAAHYADQLVQFESGLVRNEQIAQDTFLCRLEAPQIAEQCVPGQFVMIRMATHDAPLIGRAFAVWDIIDNDSGRPHAIDLIYLRKGTLTTSLATAPIGTPMSVWGPLGNGFDSRPCDRLIMAAGGIGQTPMLLLAQEALGQRTMPTQGMARPSGWAENVELIYGARTKNLLAGVDLLQATGMQVHLCTDDGSTGTQARVPDVLARRLDQIPSGENVRVVTCGPEIMMQRVSELCIERSIDCQVSMETPMACGIGICFSCVAKVYQDSNDDPPWDYKRTCVEGPIFDAHEIHWDE